MMVQQGAQQALAMADMYQLVSNAILAVDDYNLLKTISMGGLSQTPINIQPQPVTPTATLSSVMDGVGSFINTLNDTAKTVLSFFA